MTVTIPAADLVRIINDVLPFAARDDSLPMITAVYLETADGKLTATATDRYTMGHSRADCAGSLPKSGALIRYSDAVLITRLFKPARKRGSTVPQVSLTLESAVKEADPVLRVATADTLGVVHELGIGLSTVGAPFPKYQDIFAKIELPEQNSPIAFNQHYLARFAKVAGQWGEPLRFFPGSPVSASIVEIGEDFVGLIMAVRTVAAMERRLLVAKPTQGADPEPAETEPAPAASTPRTSTKTTAAKPTAAKPATRRAPARKKAAA
jgi:hypothetical protein